MLSWFQQGIIDWTKTEIFAKELQSAKILRKLKSTPVRNHLKSPLVFLVSLSPQFVVFWSALLRDNMLMGAFYLCIVTYIIDLLTCAHSKLATGFLCLCSTLESIVTVSVFLVSYCLTCCMRRNQSGSLACWTADAEDTYQPLTTISFKLKGNNFSKFDYY